MPLGIALLYAVNTFTYLLLDIDIPIISNIVGVSLVPWIFMYLSTIVFKFCSYHRMFLWYILAIDIINIIDYYIQIPFNKVEMIALFSIVSFIFLTIIVYKYDKHNKRAIQTKN